MESRLYIKLDDSFVLGAKNYKWYQSLIRVALYIAI